MAEYIARESAIEAIMSDPPDAHYQSWYAEKIKAIPADDVVPFRHGRWVDTDSEFAQCSLCKYPVYAAWNATNYCPNCGARMDGDSENG